MTAMVTEQVQAALQAALKEALGGLMQQIEENRQSLIQQSEENKQTTNSMLEIMSKRSPKDNAVVASEIQKLKEARRS